MRVDAHIGTGYICFKIRIVWPCLEITAKVPNRSVEILLRGLLCSRFIKKNDLSDFHDANWKNSQYLQKFSTAWAKCSVKHATNASLACWFKMDAINIDHSWRIQRWSHQMNLSWKYAGKGIIRSHFFARNWLSLLIAFSSGLLTTFGMYLQR